MGHFLAPVLAIALAHWDETGYRWYWLVFLMVGLSPVTIRTLNDYTLELCPAQHHPQYLSTLGLCVSLPILCSPLAGVALDVVGFEIVFFGIAAMIVLGWLMTMTLFEPRRFSTEEETIDDPMWGDHQADG